MHQKLVKKTEFFFQTAASTEEENSTIFLIKDYIGQKYMNDGGVILNTASNSANGDYAAMGRTL